MYKKIFIAIQKYIIVKKAWRTIQKNSLEIMCILKNSKVRINGKENLLQINRGNYKRIKIGIDGNNNSVIIEENVYIRNLEIIIQGNNHTVFVSKRVEIGGASIVCCGENSKVYLGEDCLLANINIKSCDGHSIYQDDIVINNSQSVNIGKNVWIAQDVNILKGVEIGDNSIVGINSLVTSNKYPSNIILGGVPAKIIKKNITWGKESTA